MLPTSHSLYVKSTFGSVSLENSTAYSYQDTEHVSMCMAFLAADRNKPRCVLVVLGCRVQTQGRENGLQVFKHLIRMGKYST